MNPEEPHSAECHNGNDLRKFRWTCIAVLSVLFLQYVLMACLYEEPYPALMLPGFRGSSVYQSEKIVINRCDIVFVDENAKEFQVSLNKLLEDFPQSHRGTIKTNFFKPPAERRRPLSAGMQKIVDVTGKILIGFQARQTPRDSPEHLASLRTWFQNRAIKIFPESRMTQVKLRWYQSIYHVGDSRHELSRTPLPSWAISLN